LPIAGYQKPEVKVRPLASCSAFRSSDIILHRPASFEALAAGFFARFHVFVMLGVLAAFHVADLARFDAGFQSGPVPTADARTDRADVGANTS
jgi:hypothetical protein